MDPRLASLERLRSGLKRLLAAFDGARAEAGVGIDRAWQGCREAFEELHRLDAESGPSRAPYPEEVRERVEEILRLHAIALESTRARQEVLRGDRERLAQARAHLDSLVGEARTGHSCDVSG